ncbi:hypothetical protein EBZ39_03740 [bacterium]|nr:hypothetical protein [bacterium]
MMTKQTEIESLGSEMIEIQTNEGTYGGSEAVRKCGTADPRFANCHLFVSVDGTKKEYRGCDPDRAPGMMRAVNTDYLAEMRVKYRELIKRR